MGSFRGRFWETRRIVDKVILRRNTRRIVGWQAFGCAMQQVLAATSKNPLGPFQGQDLYRTLLILCGLFCSIYIEHYIILLYIYIYVDHYEEAKQSTGLYEVLLHWKVKTNCLMHTFPTQVVLFGGRSPK